MERRVKERLTGAAILIMLGVIFIPMILDDSARRDTKIEETNIPDRPEGEFDSRIVPLDESQKEDPVAGSQKPGDKTTAGDDSTAESGPPTASQASAERTSDEAEEEKAVATSDADAAKQPTTTAATAEADDEDAGQPQAPKAGTESRGLSAWVVQIGSFSEENNANELAKRLQGSGYPAFIEPLEKDGKTIYRVQVGPELRRADADALKEKLNKEVEMEGLVLQYP